VIMRLREMSGATTLFSMATLWLARCRVTVPAAAIRGSEEWLSDSRPVGEPPQDRIRAIAIVLGAVLFMGVASGCADLSSQSERPDPAQMVDSGSWYSRGERWPHDGRPVESESFVVYSDGASLEARQRLASLAEEVLVEVVEEMGVDPETMYRFPPDQNKIDLYANRYNVLYGGGARAYYAGVIVPSFDHEAGQHDTDVKSVRLTLEHELVHVVETLLMGRWTGNVAVSDPRRMPTWFSEGTAEALSGGTTGGPPRTLDRVDDLIAEYGQINPISWRVDLPLSESVFRSYPNYYYPMAQLAVEYLLDADGLGRSPEDLAAVMFDMGNDVSFAEAFENHIGISQSDYEMQFFALMDTYLPQSEFPFEAVALGLVCLMAAGVMSGSLVWGQRHWSAGASGSLESEVPVWTRRARRGFVVEVWAFAFIAVGFLALALFSIGFDVLPAGTNLALLYAVTAGYFAGSVAILMWAIRRGNDRSRRAYLIPPLVIVAALITQALFDQIVF
jgi:hypothetical protein